MEKEFVPYELAVKLKELGFDEPCIAGYRDYNGIKLMTRLPNSTFPTVDSLGYGKYCKQNKHVVKAPLWQQSFDWFREKYDIDSHIVKVYDCYNVSISKWDEENSEGNIDLTEGLTFKDFINYKEARQACLEKLIQLVENENNNNK